MRVFLLKIMQFEGCWVLVKTQEGWASLNSALQSDLTTLRFVRTVLPLVRVFDLMSTFFLFFREECLNLGNAIEVLVFLKVCGKLKLICLLHIYFNHNQSILKIEKDPFFMSLPDPLQA